MTGPCRVCGRQLDECGTCACVGMLPGSDGAATLRRMARVYSELAIVARARGQQALAQSHERAQILCEDGAREVEAEYAADRFTPEGVER